jgi:hypothetical protein
MVKKVILRADIYIEQELAEKIKLFFNKRKMKRSSFMRTILLREIKKILKEEKEALERNNNTHANDNAQVNNNNPGRSDYSHQVE